MQDATTQALLSAVQLLSSLDTPSAPVPPTAPSAPTDTLKNTVAELKRRLLELHARVTTRHQACSLLSPTTWTKVLPGTQEKEMEAEVGQLRNPDLSGRSVDDSQHLQIELSPNRFQPLEADNLHHKNNCGTSSQEYGTVAPKETSASQRQDLELRGRQGVEGDLQQEVVASPHGQAVNGGPLVQSIAGMIHDLAVEVRESFEISNTNQKEIRSLCETLGQKFDDMAERTADLELEFSVLKRDTEGEQGCNPSSEIEGGELTSRA
ncbi:hypothetical protein NDU88_004660 [Pleurodeles waltl]|uniref:Uncharacterized protein n=1 Tax=Pleurodeles waltl TaxID=8319 RepID=A0AAV7L5C1_PLEWA|nr:hypothetical protein NDU88_004660 [Pleurodeles waltl]